LRVEGRDLDLERLTATLRANTGHEAQAPLTTLAGVRNAAAWAKAEAVAERLGDQHSTAYWAKCFMAAERDGTGEAAIWGAAGLALEARDAGHLRGSAGAYAVGVLRRGGSAAAA